MSDNSPYDAMFSGIIGRDYQMLQRMTPLSLEMSKLVAKELGHYSESAGRTLEVVELGSGTGITTLAMLSSSDDLSIVSIDNEPTMQNQASENLKQWVDNGRLSFRLDDAYHALTQIPNESVDVVASAYTIHNFEHSYRERVVEQIFRVLKPGGRFVNGDRYGLDDLFEHTRTVQEEISGFFDVLIGENKPDLLEKWIIHLFNDESENHVMREGIALKQLEDAGFVDVALNHRMKVNALVTAVKPA